MANLCIVICRNVNGVSELHTDILRHSVFYNYFRYSPHKFVNITNGVTHRRWLLHANPGLAQLISETIGDKWIRDPERLSDLAAYVDDATFAARFQDIKLNNKRRLAEYIFQTTGGVVDPFSIFDVQVKRLHEYKRQLLNIIHILHLYRQIKEDKRVLTHPHTFIFGAKASPGYHRAKLIIKLITSVSEFIENDSDPYVREMLKVVFIENYGVSIAEITIPAADVSEQISTAGKEASGTGCMKLMLNGAVTLGTLDGANVEIHDLVGDANMYLFGKTSDVVIDLYKPGGYHPSDYYPGDPLIERLVDFIIGPELRAVGDFDSLWRLYKDFISKDYFMTLLDTRAYVKTKDRMLADYEDVRAWRQKSLMNTAMAGFFSSDRAARQYNERIWELGM